MIVEKSQGQQFLERIKSGPPVRLHRMEELDYIEGFNPLIRKRERKIIKTMVANNLRSIPLTYSELCQKLHLNWHSLDKEIKGLMDSMDGDDCFCFW